MSSEAEVQTPPPAPVAPLVPRWRRGRTLSDGTVLHWWKQIVAVLAVYALYELVRSQPSSGPARPSTTPCWSSTGRRRSASTTSWPSRSGRCNWLPADHRQQLLLRVGLPRSPRSGSSCGSTAALRRLPAVAQHAGVHDDARAARVRLLPADAAAVARHASAMAGCSASSTRWSSTRRSGTFDSEAMRTVSNPFAAMPSLHCAWAFWGACALYPRVRSTGPEGWPSPIPS